MMAVAIVLGVLTVGLLSLIALFIGAMVLEGRHPEMQSELERARRQFYSRDS
jgi:hypothetical protein